MELQGLDDELWLPADPFHVHDGTSRLAPVRTGPMNSYHLFTPTHRALARH
jgi:hypothetical protein